jgi:argininosuccinate lyase
MLNPMLYALAHAMHDADIITEVQRERLIEELSKVYEEEGRKQLEAERRYRDYQRSLPWYKRL